MASLHHPMYVPAARKVWPSDETNRVLGEMVTVSSSLPELSFQKDVMSFTANRLAAILQSYFNIIHK